MPSANLFNTVRIQVCMFYVSNGWWDEMCLIVSSIGCMHGRMEDRISGKQATVEGL